MAIAHTKQNFNSCTYAIIHIPYHLRNITDSQKEVVITIDQVGLTVKSLLEHLFQLYPSLSFQITDETGNLVPVVSVYLNGKNIKTLKHLETELVNGVNNITFRPAIAGG